MPTLGLMGIQAKTRATVKATAAFEGRHSLNFDHQAEAYVDREKLGPKCAASVSAERMFGRYPMGSICRMPSRYEPII